MIKITDDYGRLLHDAPATAPTDGWMVDAEWAGREDCPPESWFCTSEEEALHIIRGLVDPTNERVGPVKRARDGSWIFDPTHAGSMTSYGRAYLVKAGQNLAGR